MELRCLYVAIGNNTSACENIMKFYRRVRGCVVLGYPKFFATTKLTLTLCPYFGHRYFIERGYLLPSFVKSIYLFSTSTVTYHGAAIMVRYGKIF